MGRNNMKVICIELKIVIMLFVLAVLLGVITVLPSGEGDKCTFLGRKYGIDSCRCRELCCKAKGAISSMGS